MKKWFDTKALHPWIAPVCAGLCFFLLMMAVSAVSRLVMTNPGAL